MPSNDNPKNYKNSIDVQNLTKVKAIEAIEDWLKYIRTKLDYDTNPRIKVTLITGRANNNDNGPAIKPAVEDYLDIHCYDYETTPDEDRFTFWVSHYKYFEPDESNELGEDDFF